MRLIRFGNANSLVKFENGDSILFSYGVPVAGYSKKDRYFFKTEEWFGAVVHAHARAYLPNEGVYLVTQDWVEAFVRKERGNERYA